MSALILNMRVVAQLAHAISDALRLYTGVCAKWSIEEKERAKTGMPRSRVGACACAIVST